MGAALGVHTLVRQAQPLHRSASHQVLPHDLFGVRCLHMPVPDCFWIHHHGRAVLALVQASRFVDANCRAQSGSLGKHLQLRKEIALAVLGTRGPRRSFRPGILTNKYVTLKKCQTGNPPAIMLSARTLLFFTSWYSGGSRRTALNSALSPFPAATSANTQQLLPVLSYHVDEIAPPPSHLPDFHLRQ
jgi:hypothetical protein